MNKKFTPKYLAFAYFGDDFWKTEKSFERLIKEYNGTIYFVEIESLKKYNDDGSYGAWCTIPAVLSKNTKKSLTKFAGFPRFNFGIAHKLTNLYLVDDFISYCFNHKQYKEIRTAEDIRKELL